MTERDIVRFYKMFEDREQSILKIPTNHHVQSKDLKFETVHKVDCVLCLVLQATLVAASSQVKLQTNHLVFF